MDNVTIIAAIGKNNELGYHNKLIWKFKDDMIFFKKNTINKTIVMGKNTYLSIGKALPNRKNVVLTSSNINDSNIYIINSIDNLLKYINKNKEEIMIIGGAKLYKEMLKYTKTLLLTEIEESSKADTYFPQFDIKKYERIELKTNIDEKTKIKFKHIKYIKKITTNKW